MRIMQITPFYNLLKKITNIICKKNDYIYVYKVEIKSNKKNNKYIIKIL